MLEETTTLEKYLNRNTIVEGNFRDLAIGKNKRETVESLRLMGVDSLRYDINKVVSVSDPEKIMDLWPYDEIRMRGGGLIIRFEGDNIVSYHVPHTYPKYEAIMSNAKNKSDAFSAMAEMLVIASPKTKEFRNFDSKAGWVRLSQLTEDEMVILEEYNDWTANFKDDEGFWHIKCSFDGDRLSEISTVNSQHEL